jgi:glycerol-3-phosphate O-acyltransferase
VEAQRKLIEEANGGPYKRLVFCPIVMSYHFVLEAPVLIKDHLKQVGRERFYVEQDRFSTSTKIARFLFKFFTKGSDIFVHFGAPMDVLGNRIDEEGRSVDDRGNPISLRAYFQRQGELQEDEQRDFEYTRRLADRVLDSYYKQNIVLSSHVVAFAAHRLLEKRYPQLDLYQRLRLPEEDRVFSLREITEGVERLVSAIKEMRDAGKLNAEPVLDSSTAEIIKHGIKNLGIYHDKRALRFSTRKELRRNRRNGKGKGLEQEVHSEDLSLLYFYHNRLEGYGLEQYV